MVIEPAYDIPLSEAEFALLGKLVAILGQIEEEMILSVSGLITADRPTTQKVMGSSKVADKSEIWASLVKLRSTDETLHLWVDHVLTELQALSADRNDFIHANWRLNIGQRKPMFYRRSSGPQGSGAQLSPLLDGMIQVGITKGVATATRTQNHNRNRSVADLPGVVDRAAKLSWAVAHITDRMSAGGGVDGPSAWRDRLGPTPRKAPATASTRKAREKQAPPPPSEK